MLSFGFTLIPIIHTNIRIYLCIVDHTYVWTIVWRVAPIVWLVEHTHTNQQWMNKSRLIIMHLVFRRDAHFSSFKTTLTLLPSNCDVQHESIDSFIIHCSLFIVPHSSFVIHNSPINLIWYSFLSILSYYPNQFVSYILTTGDNTIWIEWEWIDDICSVKIHNCSTVLQNSRIL